MEAVAGNIITILFTLVGSKGIALFIVRQFGKSWIETKFTERLQRSKHELDLEIQRLRVEIDSQLSGVLKAQEKEFETLPEAWGKLSNAHGLLAALVNPLQYWPELDRVTEARLAGC